MEKNKIRKYIIVLVAMLAIALVLLFVTVLKNRNELENPNDEYIFPITDKDKIEQVGSYNQYYTVTNILATYYGYIGQKEKSAVLQTLHPDYLKEHKLEEQVEKIESTDPIFSTKEMYIQTNDELYIYYVRGILKEYLDSNEYKEEYIKVYIDNNTEAFAIFPIDKNTYTDSISGKLSALETVESNDYNNFTYLTISDITKATNIFNDYKQLINEDVLKAYSILEPEYKNKKFNNVDEYKSYLENRAEINNSILSKYNIKEKNGYTEYICIDQNENKFIFKETSVLKYTVILDDYTLDTEEFIEKYNSTNEQGKMALNIQKFMQSINLKDYNYAYNCLSDGFKTNYFKTQQDFEAYIKQNFYANNNIQYLDFKTQGTTYTYTVSISNQEERTDPDKSKTFIMQLGEGTDFKLSFNVE